MGVIVVGNGPIAPEVWGRVEDTDILIRLNIFDKSHRCDIWGVGVPVDEEYCDCKDVWPLYPVHSRYDLMVDSEFVGRYAYVDPVHIYELQAKAGYYHYPRGFATTGLVAIECAVRHFNGRIGVMGFTFKSNGVSLEHWDGYEKLKEITLPCHDYELDKAYYNKLLEEKKIYEV